MNKLKKLKDLIKINNLDGYLVPKNDEFFGEYIPEYKDKSINFLSIDVNLITLICIRH